MLISDHVLLAATGSGDTYFYTQALPSQGAKYCDISVTAISVTSVPNFESLNTTVQWSNDLANWEDHDSTLVVYDVPDVKLQAGANRLPGDYIRLKYKLITSGAAAILVSVSAILKAD